MTAGRSVAILRHALSEENMNAPKSLEISHLGHFCDVCAELARAEQRELDAKIAESYAIHGHTVVNGVVRGIVKDIRSGKS